MDHVNEISNNIEYLYLVKDILENKDFSKLNNSNHHGISRLEHSMRVSYFSYKISKFLKLNYVDATRGGLLHDFYFDKENKNFTETVKEAFVHPDKAVIEASNHFVINDKQEDIIKSHMFPYCLYKMTVPKYAESWVVSLVDKSVATYEFVNTIRYRLSNASSYLLLFIFLNLVRLQQFS